MPLKKSPVLEETLHTKDTHSLDDNKDDEDETLSLCDLSFYSDENAAEWYEDLSLKSQGSSSMSSTDHDYFEFFSQELHPYRTSPSIKSPVSPPENIIFCGKIIPHKQPDISQSNESSALAKTEKQTNKRTHLLSLFTWNFSSSKGSKYGRKGTTSIKQMTKHDFSSSLDQAPKKIMYNKKQGEAHDFSPVHKVSMFTASSSWKARWYFGLFGISKYSMKVEWTDLKRRQSRRQSPLHSPPSSPNKFQSVDMKDNRGWGLIRALSCGGNYNSHANTMAATL